MKGIGNILARIASIIPYALLLVYGILMVLLGWAQKGTYLGIFLFFVISAVISGISGYNESTKRVFTGIKEGHPFLWALVNFAGMIYCTSYAPWIG